MANFQNRVCIRSMQAVVDAIQSMNQDILEARTYSGASVSDAVSLMILHRATELGREIQRVLDDVTPNVPAATVEQDEDETVPGDYDAACEWYTYNEDCSS